MLAVLVYELYITNENEHYMLNLVVILITKSKSGHHLQKFKMTKLQQQNNSCLLYTSPSPRD